MTHRSWTRSREAALWRRLGSERAKRVLMEGYGDDAGGEVLLRAFLAERDKDRAAAGFWLQVYERVRAPEIGRPEG